MQRVGILSTAETNAGFHEGKQAQASSDLYRVLLHNTSGPNSGSCGERWVRLCQLLVEKFDPHIRSRTAGQLLSVLQFDFSGNKLEAYERDLALCEQAC